MGKLYLYKLCMQVSFTPATGTQEQLQQSMHYKCTFLIQFPLTYPTLSTL